MIISLHKSLRNLRNKEKNRNKITQNLNQKVLKMRPEGQNPLRMPKSKNKENNYVKKIQCKIGKIETQVFKTKIPALNFLETLSRKLIFIKTNLTEAKIKVK